MLSLSSPSSRSDRDNQLTFSDEEAPSPRKTPAHRLCTYFVLWSFLFQTLWPSMVFARHEVALGSVWRTEQSGLTFQVESYRETGTSRKLIRVQAFSKEDEEEEAFTPAAKPAEDLGRSSPSASPRVFPPLALPEQKEVLVETPSAAAPSLTPPPSPLDESPPPSPRTALRKAIKKLLDRVVDIQTFQAIGSGVVLYNDLSIKAEGISWAFGGLAFVLDWQGNILTTGNAQFDMGVNIDAPGKVGLDNVSVKQVSARGQDVVVRGKGKIGRLDAWATGRDGSAGVFRITEDSDEEMGQLYLHQGKGENLGHLTIQESFQHTEVFDNHETLTLRKGAVVKGGKSIVNLGAIEGEEYTLQSALIRNEDKDRKKATIKATKTLTLEGQKLEHKGALAASSLRLAVDEIEDSTSSTIKADRLTTVLKKSWDAQGTIDIDRWQDTSAETVVIQNQGKIITRQQASLAAQLRNLKEGKVDLTGVELRNSREQSQPFVNEGEMILRKVKSLGGTRRKIENRAGAKLLFMDHGYRKGCNQKSVPTTSSLQLDKRIVADSEGLHLGDVMNAGTLGFGEGTYCIHGLFKNERGGVQEVLEGQDLWQEDFINDGEVKASSGYRMDQTQGIFSKLGKVSVRGQGTTKVSERAVRQKTGGTTWQHTGHLEMDEWLDESESGVTFENKGTIISRHKTTVAAHFENGKGGTADFTEVSFDNFKDRYARLHNQGELTLRRIRSLGQARRDIFNSHGAKLTLLDCGYSLKEWDSTTGGFTLGKVDNYGVIGFRGGNFYTKVFTNHHEHEALPGQWLWSDDFINHGVTKIHTKHYLVDYTRGGTFSKLGKIEALKGGVMIKFSEQTNAAQYVSQLPLRDWKLKDHLTIWAPIFHNTVDWGVGFPLELLIASFLNDAKLHSYGLTLKARTYAQGTAGHRLGEIKCSGPLVMEVEGDIDNRNGRIEAEGEGEITSTHGDILLGQGVGGDYRQKNGAFAYSAKGLKLKARNMHISFGEVGSGQRLELKFLEKLVLESATVRSRGKSTFQGRSVVITRAAPYYSQGETVCDWRFWCNQWRHRDGGDAAQVLSGGDLSFLVDDLTIVGSHVTAMGDITDKYGVRRTKDNLGYFSVQPMDYYEHAEKHDKWPATVHNRCDSRGSTFSASGQINLTFSQYQLASLMMAASGIGLQGDGFLLGSASATSSHALVLTSGYISLLPALQSMVGGITHYRSPQENPYVVYSTGSFTTNVIDPALLTLVRDSMTMASFLMNPTADCRHLRQLTDEEGLIAAIQLVLMAATGKGYLFPKKGAGEHICLLLDNARSQQKEGRSFTLEEVKRSKVPLLTAQPQTLQGETVAVPCLYLPPGYITEHLFEPSQGTMVAEVEGIHVNMSTFLGVSGGVMAAEKKGIDLASGGGMALRSAVERIGDAHNHRDQMTRAAFYAPGDGLRATAAEEMTLGAIRTRTGVGGTSITGASVVDGSVALQSHRTTSHEGGETRTTMVTHAVSDHQSQGPFAQTATRGAVEAYAHQVTAPTVALSGHAGVNIHDVHNTVQTTTTTRESSGFLGGSTTVQEESASSRSQGAVYQTEKPVEVSSAAGSVRTTTSLRANHGITFKVPQGALEVIASMDFSSYSRTETGSSVLWQSVSHDASASRTYSMGEISGPVRVRARDGVVVETVKGKTLEWLARLDAGDSQVIQRELEEEHRIHHFDQEGPTMALAAVISLAVTIATSGTGASLGASVAGIQTGVAATTAQAFVQGAVQTAFTGICSQAAIGLVRHQGHIGMAVQDLTSSNSLRSIGIAAITAGTVQGVGTALGTPGTSLEATLRARKGAEAAAAASRLSAPTLAQRLAAGFQQHFQHHAVRTAVSSAIQMGTAQRSADVLKWSVKGLTAGVIGAMVANEIGYAAMADPAEPLNPIVHKMLHAGLGAGTGAIMDGADGARAGAIGGVVAEVMAEVIKPETDAVMERVEAKAQERGITLEGPGSDERISALIQEEMRSTVDLSRLSGAVAALLTGQDVATAEVAATNAVENNFLQGAVVGGVALYRLYRIANAAYRGYRAADLAGRAAGHMAEKLEERAKAGDAGKTAGSGGGSGGLEPDPGEGTEDHDREQFSKETKEILGRTDRFKGELFERAGKSKDQTTLSAAQKELKGDQIPLAQERGMTYDHITKVRDAQGGLLNLVDRINRRLGFPGLPAAERLALQQELSSASRLLDHTKSFVPRS